MTADMEELKRRMEGAAKLLSQEFSGLRTGRASASLLDHIHVDAYGSSMPLNQMASVSVPESALITVQVWDSSNIKAVEKAIANANLGVNPSVDGAVIRVPIPPLSQERRVELTKIAKKYAEEAKVSIRNVRRDGMETLKKMEKDGEISKDEHTRMADDIQKLTDTSVKKIDEVLAVKEKEILGG